MKILLLFLLLSLTTLCSSLPLSARSRWIVSEPTGARVKLAGVNWAGHLDAMLPEGLHKRPVSDIAKEIRDMGFNSVRLTWPIYMFTRYANVTVAGSFEGLGLHDALEGIARNNPGLVNMTVVDAHRAVVEALGENGVMVILDNHLSKPMWCCSTDDGNGFFGDKYFDPKEWLQGLHIVAKRYKDTPMVVGMSLRNELRGPLQNQSVWYKYVARGARIIHKTNPNLLVIISGLDYDIDFTYLKEKPLNLNMMKNKLVYEMHRYSFTRGQKNLWMNETYGEVCKQIVQEIERDSGFLVEGPNGAPLFVSEFGINQAEVDKADWNFLECFLGYLAEMDLDWAVWALQGGYYTREGLIGPEETFGMLDSNWSSIRNPVFHRRLQLIQQQLRDPNRGHKYHLLYDPSSGRCIRVDNWEVRAGDCRGFSRWSHDGDGKPIRLMNSGLCLSAAGEGKPVVLSTDCESRRSRWELIAGELANKDENGDYLCLRISPNPSSRVLTNKCAEIPQLKLIEANAE